jgi:hypothetical protein
VSELGEIFSAHGDLRKARRKLFGINCPECVRLLPKAHPTILLPQQRCRIHGYRDPRPHLTDAQEQQVAESLGWTLKDPTK